MRSLKSVSLGICCALLATPVFADIVKARLTQIPAGTSSAQVISLVNARVGANFKAADFTLVERTTLATSNFEMLVQMRAGKPIAGTRLRIWKNKLGQIIVAEAHVDKPSLLNGFGLIAKSSERFLQKNYLENEANLAKQEQLVRQVIAGHHDASVTSFEHEDLWQDTNFVRVFTGTGQRGTHSVSYLHSAAKVIATSYREHHQAELPPVEAMGYKVYEQNWYNPLETMEPEVLELKYLNDKVVAQTTDPFAVLSNLPLLRSKYDEERGSTMEGVQQGFWSYALLSAMADEAGKKIVPADNGFSGPEGLVLDGRYVSINVHPGARKIVPENTLVWRYGADIQQDMVPVARGDLAVLFKTGLRGRTYGSPADLMNPPMRDANHSVEAYLKDGADQVQVYWAVTEMMEKLQVLGFTDPEISKRKFQAYLYNPDPFYKNNAFYVNDTINFTTYTASASNFARDNTTIWHEIGHGIIDRLLGEINLIKGEGFHEGIADFLAEVVLQATSYQREFPGRSGQRIYNVSAFNFANEAHDDGEAFGGLMKDILDRAITKWGKDGLTKTTDLVFEAMRFTRGHPALDEQEWVEKLLFADSRANLRREAGEFRQMIEESLAPRNFSADGKDLASMQVKIDDQILRRGGVGGRNSPMYRPKGSESRFMMKVRLLDGKNYKFAYPLKIKVAAGNGAEGPIDWIEEELGSRTITLSGPNEEALLEMGTTGKCDVQNLGNTCRESMFIEAYSPGDKKPRARQRIYIQLGAPVAFN